MATLTSIREALDLKIWNSGISRTITLQNVSSSVEDAYGEEYDTLDAGTSVKAVPYNTFGFQRDFLPWGELADGQTDMALRYDADVQVNSILVDTNDTSVTYEVIGLEDFKFGDGVAAKVARLRQIL